MNIIKTYNVSELPDIITGSTYFSTWRGLFPEDQVICLNEDLYITDFTIHSQQELDRLIKADQYFGFEKKLYCEIFKSVEHYWREDPNSSPFVLPEEQTSWLVRQLVGLFTEQKPLLLLLCMKRDYTELFDYAVETHGLIGNHVPFVFPLLYYAVMNNNIEVFKRGVNAGLPFTEELFDPVLKTNNEEIFRLMFEKQIKITYKSEQKICKSASPTLFKIFLEHYIDECKNNPFRLLIATIHNIDNFRELILNQNVACAKLLGRTFIYDLFINCMKSSVQLEIVLLTEQYFGITMAEFIIDNNQCVDPYLPLIEIHPYVIRTDNLDLYMHLFCAGLRVTNKLRNQAIDDMCVKITPGLIKKHLEEQS
jgi:hypothetical protein